MMDHRPLRSVGSCLDEEEPCWPDPFTLLPATLAGNNEAIRRLKMSSENSTLNYLPPHTSALPDRRPAFHPPARGMRCGTSILIRASPLPLHPAAHELHW